MHFDGYWIVDTAIADAVLADPKRFLHLVAKAPTKLSATRKALAMRLACGVSELHLKALNAASELILDLMYLFHILVFQLYPVALADTDATVNAAAMCMSACVVHCSWPPANSTVDAGVAQLMLAGASISTSGWPNFSTGAAPSGAREPALAFSGS